MQQNAIINNMERRLINDLQPGQIVAEDLYVENRRLLSKGHILTERIIHILQNRNVQHVPIVKSETISVESSTTSIVNTKQEHLPFNKSQDLLMALGRLSSETRYGKILNNSEDIQLLTSLFATLLEDATIDTLLTNLQIHDEQTYLHSVDVFTLGTLFAISEGLDNIEEIAFGFLFHDIGKLNTASTLLNKKQPLTESEYAMLQCHTIEGFEILCSNGFSHIAHYAKSHHERSDGSGYPDGLQTDELSIELQILQLIDVYSALTMDRPYRNGMTAVMAIEKLFKQATQFNVELLHHFIDYIGIYPENAVVLLSNGHQAIIQRVNTLYPLLPTVKVFATGHVLTMPMDFSLSIHKLLTFYVDSPQELFSKFSDFLINNDEPQMRRYYHKLKQHYPQNEWFNHIYLPAFHVLRVLNNYDMVPEMRFKEVKNTVLSMLEDTLKLFRKNDDHRKKRFMILLGNVEKTVLLKLFEGLLHCQNIYPFISPADQSKEAVEHIVKLCGAESIIMLGKSFNHLPTLTIPYYHLNELQLESFISQYSGRTLDSHQLIQDLQKFSKTGALFST